MNSPPSSSESSPTVAQQVEALMHLPGSLCKQRGICCRVATFRGLATPQDLATLAQEASPLGDHARAFASIFEPYPTVQAVQAIAPEFVARVAQKAQEKGQSLENIGFYRCRFVLDDGRCGVHEDRPSGCRGYPVVHQNTLFHPGCGYENAVASQWKALDALLKDHFGMGADALLAQSTPEIT
ncbi:MAG: hypothetical protein U0003_01230 [Vampirovibrionales bacterium]